MGGGTKSDLQSNSTNFGSLSRYQSQVSELCWQQATASRLVISTTVFITPDSRFDFKFLLPVLVNNLLHMDANVFFFYRHTALLTLNILKYFILLL